MNRILALKDLGLSLEQIVEVLSGTLSADELRDIDMLRLKRVQLSEQMQAMQTQLEQVEARLTQIDLEGTMPNFEVVLKTIDSIIVAGRRIIVTKNNECPVWLGEAFQEAYDHVQAHGKQTGPGIAIWYWQQLSNMSRKRGWPFMTVSGSAFSHLRVAVTSLGIGPTLPRNPWRSGRDSALQPIDRSSRTICSLACVIQGSARLLSAEGGCSLNTPANR